jgi:hypothetical protein
LPNIATLSEPTIAPTVSLSTLLKVAKTIEQIITKYSILGQVKGALTDVANMVRKASNKEGSEGPPIALTLIKAFYDQINTNL